MSGVRSRRPTEGFAPSVSTQDADATKPWSPVAERTPSPEDIDLPVQMRGHNDGDIPRHPTTVEFHQTSPLVRAPDTSEFVSSDVQLLDAVISALPSGIITTDADDRITHINNAAATILGRHPEDLRGALLPELRGELEAMLWPADKGEVLLIGLGRPGELQFRESRVLGFSSRRLRDSSGNRSGTVISFSDITEVKARGLAEEHRRRLADIGKVVSTIAHEIRNPVFAIASLAQVLCEEDGIRADRELSMLVGKILEESRRIGRLVDDLLAFGRESPVVRSRTNVVELVATLAADMERALLQGEGTRTASSVALRVHVSPNANLDPVWDLDAEAIRRVLSNLVRNAWQATLARSPRRPEHDGIDLRIDRGSDWLHITVEDRGVGIPEDKLPQIFDAFFTLRHHGTGLGLAVAKRLVQQHRGSIRVESILGKGTRVTVRLPP